MQEESNINGIFLPITRLKTLLIQMMIKIKKSYIIISEYPNVTAKVTSS